MGGERRGGVAAAEPAEQHGTEKDLSPSRGPRAICFFGKPVLVPAVCSLLLGELRAGSGGACFCSESSCRAAAAAFLVMLLLTAGLWGVHILLR